MAKPDWIEKELGALDEGQKKEPTASLPVKPATSRKPTERHAAAVSNFIEDPKPRKKPGPSKPVPDRVYSVPMHPEMFEEAVAISEAMESRFGVKVSVRQVLAKALESGFKMEYENFYGKPYKGKTRS